MKTIKINTFHRHAEGSFASYIIFNKKKKIGLKLFEYNGAYDIESLINSKCRLYRLVKKEFKFLQKAYKSGFTPKPYEIVIIQSNNNRYYLGILMEHLDFPKLRNMEPYDWRKCEKIGERIKKKLKSKTGIIHEDLHASNILVKLSKTNKILKYFVIDFTPNLIKNS